MRYLGIDYGTKKIGLALSDETGSMAFPREVVPNDGDFLAKLVGVIEAEGVGAVVIGHSLNKDGSDNTVQAAINELVTDLTLQLGIPVHLEPEQYTTQEALLWQDRNELTDASAAAIILNSYLTRNKS